MKSYRLHIEPKPDITAAEVAEMINLQQAWRVLVDDWDLMPEHLKRHMRIEDSN